MLTWTDFGDNDCVLRKISVLYISTQPRSYRGDAFATSPMLYYAMCIEKGNNIGAPKAQLSPINPLIKWRSQRP